MNLKVMVKRGGLIYMIGICIFLLQSCFLAPVEKLIDKRQILFNSDWKFHKDNLSGGVAGFIGPENPNFDDSDWRIIDLPHDWSIEHLPGNQTEEKIGPFLKVSTGGGRINAWVEGGIGWYRKHFVLEKSDSGKVVVIKFDGIYNESEIWVNGKSVGTHKNGYSPFWFDITGYLNPVGKPNVITIKVENIGKTARWYSGSGIYRNVHLIVTNPLHVGIWGVKVNTPEINANAALVQVDVTIQNDKDIAENSEVRIKILNPNGEKITEVETIQKILGGKENIISKELQVTNPELWSLKSPKLYIAEVEVLVDNLLVDQYRQSFGIRSIEFSVEKGFLLNGESILLKGGSVHHDNGLLGSKAINRAEERRVEIMKKNGFNAIRCSHNPPSEAFLDACDRLGMLVIDEFFDVWETSKTDDDYSKYFKGWWRKDLKSVILRDRNHPSVIMWSIGNEIPEAVDLSGVRIGQELIAEVKKLDSTRAVTEAHVDLEQMMGLKSNWDKRAPYLESLDVVGYNYDYSKYETDHIKHPQRIVYGSESFPRDVFEFWKAVEKYSWVIGDFVWTGMDYYGESGIGKSIYISKDGIVEATGENHLPANLIPLLMENAKKFEQNMTTGQSDYGASAAASVASPWPWFNAWCGDVDITGDRKPQKAYKDVIWNETIIEMHVHAPIPEGKKEVVSLWGWPDEWPSWNWKGNEGKPLQVRVFTKAANVRLELNGQTIGEKQLTIEDKYIAVFEVPYQQGELKALAIDNGKVVASKILKTTGDPFAISLTADRSRIKADRNDLSFVKIEIVDKDGLLVPTDSIRIKISVSGKGELAASGTANPLDMESVNGNIIKTYKGRALAILRPYKDSGIIILKVAAEGLNTAELKIECQ